jgi:hypothetical protein
MTRQPQSVVQVALLYASARALNDATLQDFEK